jgi:catechol 2,3-dioxygenase-like lactoylglutathione lyase family enzyme
MDIRQFRVVLRARSFERTRRFYAEVLALPELASWQGEGGRGALFEAGTGVVEVLGRAEEGGRDRDEAFDYQGPRHKLTLTLVVPSAERAYETLHFRDPNLPGGLSEDPEGGLQFATHDPDGVQIVFREAGAVDRG